jgi:hypothetical protein
MPDGHFSRHKQARLYARELFSWRRTSENSVKRKSNFGEYPFYALG